MTRLAAEPARPPAVFFGGEAFAAERIAEWAEDWKRQLSDHAGRPVFLVLHNHPEFVALLFAVSGVASASVLLGGDERAWPAQRDWPEGAVLCLAPSQARRADPWRERGVEVLVLDAPRRCTAGALALSGPVLGFTSGSTGVPKPVCRTFEGSVAGARSMIEARSMSEALPYRPGAGIVSSLLGMNLQALHPILLASLLGSELGLPERGDHRTLLSLFATGRFGAWIGSVAVARLLAECPLEGPPPPSPSIVHVGGSRLPRRVFRAYLDRFGVPPRPAYGSTELGILTADYGPAEEVDPDTAGRAVPGAQMRVDADGRLWGRTPWVMSGYGYPPHLERGPGPDGWLPTEDEGWIDDSGRLHLVGRRDARFKTAAGRLVDPALVEAALLRHAAVAAAVAVPLPAGPGAAGALVGAVVACGDDVGEDALRLLAAQSLPDWARPQSYRLVDRLPVTELGKVDVRACRELFGEAPREAGPGPHGRAPASRGDPGGGRP